VCNLYRTNRWIKINYNNQISDYAHGEYALAGSWRERRVKERALQHDK